MTQTTGQTNGKNTFSKTERLCSRKEIDRLFADGSSLNMYPLKLMYVRRDELPDIPAKTMFVVPKRSFRKAHDRNLLRRRMRESFRLEKKALYDALKMKNTRVSVAILFTGKQEADFDSIRMAVRELLARLHNRL